jgi:hypothetical protein
MIPTSLYLSSLDLQGQHGAADKTPWTYGNCRLGPDASSERIGIGLGTQSVGRDLGRTFRGVHRPHGSLSMKPSDLASQDSTTEIRSLGCELLRV